jgi:hypothetical protein
VKRISFSVYEAEHVYEWLRMYCGGDQLPFGGCDECKRVGRRLKRLIGPAAVRRIVRLVQKHPFGRAVRTASKLEHRQKQIDAPFTQLARLEKMIASKKKHDKRPARSTKRPAAPA